MKSLLTFAFAHPRLRQRCEPRFRSAPAGSAPSRSRKSRYPKRPVLTSVRKRPRQPGRFAHRSLGPEDPVTGVAEPGNDIAVVVQMFVERADVDVDVRVILGQLLYALRRRDDAKKTDIPLLQI